MKLYKAIIEYIEARAELLREEAAGLSLGTYARGYKDGQADIFENADVVYVDEEDDG